MPASEVATERGNGSSKSASDAAKERAAKLTAMLAAKGKLANNVGAPLPSVSQLVSIYHDSYVLITQKWKQFNVDRDKQMPCLIVLSCF